MTEPGPERSTEPARIGPYRLARRLGQGGMGEVFLAWDDRLGRRVAVKRIRHGEPTGTDRERLRREARAAARLSHPYVVQIYDLVEDEAGDAIVLEYVEGRTLRDILSEGLPAARTRPRPGPGDRRRARGRAWGGPGSRSACSSTSC